MLDALPQASSLALKMSFRILGTKHDYAHARDEGYTWPMWQRDFPVFGDGLYTEFLMLSRIEGPKLDIWECVLQT